MVVCAVPEFQTTAGRQQALQTLRQHRIEAVAIIGGNGSMVLLPAAEPGQASGWSPSRCEHTHKVLILCRSLFLSIVSLARNSEQDREWAEPTVLGPLRKATPQ